MSELSERPSAAANAPAAPAGWYPIDGRSQRYWDGYEWSNHTAPLHHSAAPALAVVGDDTTWSTLAHLSTFVLPILGPLIIWLVKSNSPFISHHGKQALNFQLSLMIYGIISLVLVFFLIGLLLIPALIIADIVLSILAAIAANRGELYRYPFTINFFR